MQRTLFRAFEQLADAQGGVAKLRQFILKLACAGKLLHNGDSAAATITEGTPLANECSSSPTLRQAEWAGESAEVPSSWSLTTVGTECKLATGATPSRSNSTNFGGDIKWLVSGDIHQREIFDCEGRITEAALKSSNCKLLPKDSVLIALNGQGKTRATVAVLRVPAACNQSLVAMTPICPDRLTAEYLYWNLRSRYFAIREITGQEKRRGLNMKLVGQLVLALPPIEEQARIVAKVDELMALCDALEARQTTRSEARRRLHAATLHHVTAARSPSELAVHWSRLRTHFDPLHASPDSIPALRQTILQLAIQGRLVPQNPKDKIGDSIPELLPRSQPLTVPKTWRWTEFGEIGKIAGGFAFKSGDYAPTGVFVLRVTNIAASGVITKDEAVFLTPHKVTREIERFYLDEGDILLVMVGGSLGKIGVVNADILPALLNQNLWRITPVNEEVDRQFLRLMTDFAVSFQRQITHSTHGHLSREEFRKKPVALPPLAEQKRIVAKVEQLLALCDELETRLKDADARRERLLTAAIHDALSPSSC